MSKLVIIKSFDVINDSDINNRITTLIVSNPINEDPLFEHVLRRYDKEDLRRKEIINRLYLRQITEQEYYRLLEER